MSEYAKHTITQKLQQILPCDFLIKIKGSSTLALYIPELYKGRIIGKSGANIIDLEKNLGLKIDIKGFDELPLLDVNVKISTPKKNARTDILFPKEFAGQTICFLIGDEIAYFTADDSGIVIIKNKELVKSLGKK
jgi:predicted PilT family ATPase